MFTKYEYSSDLSNELLNFSDLIIKKSQEYHLKKYRFLFLLEREFHISLFENLIKHIRNQDLGEIGIMSTSYIPSRDGRASSGARLNVITEIIGNEFIPVNVPADFSPDITYFADTPSEYDGHLGFKVCIGHGTICKGSFYVDSTKIRRDNFADLICVPGSIHKEVLQKNIFKPIEVTGIPKLDPMFSGKLKRNDILEKFGLDPQKRTILFAPTYNREFSLLPFLKGDFRSYFPDYTNVIVKLHGIEREEVKEHYRNLSDNDKSISYSENHNIVECFAAADLLVSDVSSVVYEFAASGKPVILFDSPLQKKHPKYNENDLEYRFRDVGSRFSNPYYLKHLILQFLIMPESTESIASQFVSVRDGSSTERVITKAIEYLENKIEKSALHITESINGNHNKLSRRFSRDFNVRIIKDHSEINGVKNGDPIVVLNGNYQYSSMFSSLLRNHHEFEDAEIYIPMISERFGSITQSVNVYHPQANGIADSLIGDPVVSASPGESVYYNSDFFPVAFSYAGSDSKTLAVLVDACVNNKIVKEQDMSVRIAKDCFAYRG